MEKQFMSRLLRLGRSYRRYIDRGLVGLPLSHSTALAVMVLGRLPDGVRQGVLAEELGIEGPSLVPLLGQIERAGLVERRVDPGDKRARMLHLTDAGKALAAEAEQLSGDLRRQLFAELPAGDIAVASRVLDHLFAMMTDPERN